ncbi:hypothetical protein KM043_004641 [Ampulex compressa]|nr:hypothetical protein KM043_004641 [Ampulex compressa]
MVEGTLETTDKSNKIPVFHLVLPDEHLRGTDLPARAREIFQSGSPSGDSKRRTRGFSTARASRPPDENIHGIIAPYVDNVAAMYVMETGGHKVAPAPTTRVKKVEYKSMNHEGVERGGGGGTHLAATVKNTVRRLLRRTKSHRDAPSTNAATMTVPINGNPASNVPNVVRNKSNNAYDPTARRSQPPLPPPSERQLIRKSCSRRYSRARGRLQVREKERKERSERAWRRLHAMIWARVYRGQVVCPAGLRDLTIKASRS